MAGIPDALDPDWASSLLARSPLDNAAPVNDSLSPATYTPSQRIGNAALDFMTNTMGMQPHVAQHLRDGLGGVLGLTPAAIPVAAADAIEAKSRGDLGGTAVAMMGMLPGAGKLGREVAPAVQEGIRAFHGSPHDFDKFSLDKIGTGEGAQAYGHGMYFAENEGVARSYRDALSPDPVTVKHLRNNGGLDQEIERLQEGVATSRKAAAEATDPEMRQWYEMTADHNAKQIAQYEKLKAGGSAGHMYEVNIEANPEHFLDWDKPFSQQSPHVQKAWSNLAPGHGFDRTPGQNLYRHLTDEARRVHWQDNVSDHVVKSLNEAGVPGIKYFDAGSRGGGADGSRNFVVFDDKLVNIVKKYGLAGVSMLPPAAAAFLSQRITPVDHNPFGHGITPVEHDPFNPDDKT